MNRPANGRAHLSIGEVLSLLQDEFPDVTISKIRFLESQGLLDPERTPSGYRKFYDSDIVRLRWVLRQQREHYLPLKVIKDRLDANGGQVPDDAFGDGEDASGERDDVNGMLGVRHLSAQSLEGAQRNGTSATLLPPRPSVADRQSAADPQSAEGTARARPRSGASFGGSGAPGAGAERPSAPPTGPPERWTESVHDKVALEVERAKSGRARILPAPPPPPAPPLSRRSPDQSEPRDGTDSTGLEDRQARRRVLPEPSRRDEVPRAEPTGPAPAGSSGPESSSGSSGSSGSPGSPGSIRLAEGADRVEGPEGAAGPGVTGSEGPAAGPVLAGSPDLSLTVEELAEASGLSVRDLRELEKFGLIEPLSEEGPPLFDGHALVVAQAAAGFLQHGIQARHLRSYKVAIEREANLYEQVVMPLLKQRNPEARRRATQTVTELMRLGEVMRGALLRRELRSHLDDG